MRSGSSDRHVSSKISLIRIVLPHSVLAHLSASSIPLCGAGAVPLRHGAFPMRLTMACLCSQSYLVTSKQKGTHASPLLLNVQMFRIWCGSQEASPLCLKPTEVTVA